MNKQGHNPAARKSFAGLRFGRLTVQEIARINERKNVIWKCICDCGNEHEATSNALSMERVKSCGCLKRERDVTWGVKHGMYHTDERRIHILMLDRCRNPNNRAYHRYGGRGITVCERWQGENGLVNFVADMGRRPSKNHSVDRIDNNKGYSPDNCRWATASVQARNKNLSVRNKSGFVGVSWVGRDQAWQAYARIEGKRYNLLWSKDFWDAVCARKSFELKNPIGV